MEIKDVALTKAQKAIIFNRLTGDDYTWEPEEFENDDANIHITLNNDERIALLTGVAAHDYLNPDEARLIQVPMQTRMDLGRGEGVDKEVVLRMTESGEHGLLEAAAWTVRHADEIEAYTPVEATIERDVEAEQEVTNFREAMVVLSRIVMELEVAGVIQPEQLSD